jgi:predicted ATPase
VIKSIKAEGYKSIKKLELELGRVNVFIGENGAGKSNILEVFALAGAAVARKLDNEFLSSRGVRVTEPEYMRSAFLSDSAFQSILISIAGDEGDGFFIKLDNDGSAYAKWGAIVTDFSGTDVVPSLLRIVDDVKNSVEADEELKQKIRSLSRDILLNDEKVFVNINLDSNLKDTVLKRLDKHIEFEFKRVLSDNVYSEALKFFRQEFGDQILRLVRGVSEFILYSPENSALRIFKREGQIEPLGINGEGLMKLLSVLSKEEHCETLQEIKSSLQVLGWFEDFKLVDGDAFSLSRIAIKDRYIEETGRYFDQMSANEGFLFLLFYFALFSTKLTPSIFAIDNIDASLNPALCEKLLRELVRLAKKHDKQALLTTHNPAVLDGLNLDDDEQRLFVVSRSQSGETRVRRIQKKASTSEKEKPIRLSEMFLRGSLGGLPKGF